ncbi:ATP-binding protein [Litchfieldia alkalitelluris]|uniref:ATP-binding protein n=1 Tax=Litchfieldia alkalitelluris TaxID=304268 RepID=UPI00099850F9|nr:ATP-binding protein [Litchfieldia alkalitelluris]
MDIFKDLVLNLFFIFICYSIFLYLEEKNRRIKEGNNKLNLIVFTSIAVILCITFPIHINEEVIFDLRLIPIVIASLYGGMPAILTLLFVNIGYRFLLGGDGVYATIIIATFTSLLTALIYPLFLNLAHRNRIMLSGMVGLVASGTGIITVEWLFKLDLSQLLIIGLILLHTCGLLFFVMIFEWITKYRDFHERLIRSEKMEVVSYLASSFSHEVRNPMTTVRGFLQLIKHSDIDKQKLDSYINIAISEIDRAESIITEYLLFTKPNSNELHMIKGETVLLNSIEVIRPLASANCVDIRYNSFPFLIKGNKQRLQQALINVFKNAIEAMSNGGTLFIDVRSTSRTVEIVIRDTGEGMTKEQIRRLGEPYFSTKGDKGTGLGMMVVYNIVESIGGSIKVNSHLGKGTEFIISFPQSHLREVGTKPSTSSLNL